MSDLSNAPIKYDTTMDSIVIIEVTKAIPGGKTLDVTGVTEEVLKAGRVIIEETATGKLKPLKIIDGEYEDLPEGFTCKGLLVATILTKKPFASVMLEGSVNYRAAINWDLPVLEVEIKTGLNRILFT